MAASGGYPVCADRVLSMVLAFTGVSCFAIVVVPSSLSLRCGLPIWQRLLSLVCAALCSRTRTDAAGEIDDGRGIARG